MHIPDIEAIYLGAIPTSEFISYFLTDGGSRFLEVSVGAGAHSALLERGAAWGVDDDQRRTADRQARGERTLAEMVEASYGSID